MLRLIIIALVIVFILTLIRAAAGVIRHAMLQTRSPGDGAGKRPNGPVQGELKRDPVCGTFIPAGTALQKTVKGEVLYFCSAECRDRYVAA